MNRASDHGDRWRRRYRAPRVWMPAWARGAPDRLLYSSNAGGRTELFAWDRVAGSHRQVTDRPEGTVYGQIDPAGELIWWWADERGSERGGWMAQPFDGGGDVEAAPGLPAAYTLGLALGRDFAVVGSSTDDGTMVHRVRPGEHNAELLYAHRQVAGVAGVSRDETLLCISHSEHGDANHRALRVIDLDGNPVADLWDGPGLGVGAGGWSRVPGDQRLLVMHERAGAWRPLIWSPLTGEATEIHLDLTGDVRASWFPDASALLLVRDHRGRSELYRLELDGMRLEPLAIPDGTIMSAAVRPDGETWYAWSSSSTPLEVRCPYGLVLSAPGEPAPGGVSYTDVDVSGIPVFLAEPPDVRPHPTVFLVHGGPTGQDRDVFSPAVQAWVDHGYAVVLVNYRGSTGYGREWRDALIGNVGFGELSDIAQVQDWAVEQGVADPARCVIAGGSWGGYLALLALGTQPERWSVGVADVPIADWFQQLEDEMEPLRRYDEALFGVPVSENPDLYRERSPITHVERVRAPVYISGGLNDPRCPIRPIDSYVGRLEALGKAHEYYRFEAGHGSENVDEQIRQMENRLEFAGRHLAAPAAAPERGSVPTRPTT